MSIAALIVAAGRGTRMGGARPKALLRLAGVSMLERAIAPFLSHPGIETVVAAVADPDEARAALGPVASRIVMVRGGEERQDSVRFALQSVGAPEIVLVHDAARALVPRPLIDAVIETARRFGAAIPAIAVADTLKRIAADGSVAATLGREDLRLAQTPQGFRTTLLRDAYARAERDGYRGTDDAGLVEHAGGRVMIVEGSPLNFKITRPEDLDLAEAMLRAGSKQPGGERG